MDRRNTPFLKKMARIYFYRRRCERCGYIISKFPCVFLVCIILLFIHHQSSTVVRITLKSVLYRRRKKIYIHSSSCGGWCGVGWGVAGDLCSNRGRCSARNRRDHAPSRFESSPGPPSIYFTSLITRNAKVLTRSTRTATTASTRGRYLFRMHLTVKTVRSRCLINGLCS